MEESFGAREKTKMKKKGALQNQDVKKTKKKLEKMVTNQRRGEDGPPGTKKKLRAPTALEKTL